MTIDYNGFESEMEKQRDRARTARQDVDSMQVQSGVLRDIHHESKFVGYDQLQVQATVVVLLKDGVMVEKATTGEEIQFILDQTPFYAESGGQIADKGTLLAHGVKVDVLDVKKAPNGQSLHRAMVVEGELNVNAAVTATVIEETRAKVIKNHSATHLMHQALKDVLGPHVNQAGSLVEPDRLRFDFSHFGQVQPEELERVEEIVNEQIWRSLDVEIDYKGIDEAKSMGAMALFGEKYGDIVRVVKMGDYSLELCGGCHVPNSSVIGLFKIVSESGIGAGTRRIEAVTGEAAYSLMNHQIGILKSAAAKLKTNVHDVPARIDTLQNEMKHLHRENESLAAKLGNIEAGSLASKVKDVNGIPVLVANVQNTDMNNLRNMADDLKQKLGSGVIVLGSAVDGKVNLIAGVTKDLIEKGFHAGKLIKEVSTRCGGGGGGRPDMAQAGGKDPSKLDSALEFVEEWVKAV